MERTEDDAARQSSRTPSARTCHRVISHALSTCEGGAVHCLSTNREHEQDNAIVIAILSLIMQAIQDFAVEVLGDLVFAIWAFEWYDI